MGEITRPDNALNMEKTGTNEDSSTKSKPFKTRGKNGTKRLLDPAVHRKLLHLFSKNARVNLCLPTLKLHRLDTLRLRECVELSQKCAHEVTIELKRLRRNAKRRLNYKRLKNENIDVKGPRSKHLLKPFTNGIGTKTPEYESEAGPSNKSEGIEELCKPMSEGEPLNTLKKTPKKRKFKREKTDASGSGPAKRDGSTHKKKGRWEEQYLPSLIGTGAPLPPAPLLNLYPPESTTSHSAITSQSLHNNSPSLSINSPSLPINSPCLPPLVPLPSAVVLNSFSTENKFIPLPSAPPLKPILPIASKILPPASLPSHASPVLQKLPSNNDKKMMLMANNPALSTVSTMNSCFNPSPLAPPFGQAPLNLQKSIMTAPPLFPQTPQDPTSSLSSFSNSKPLLLVSNVIPSVQVQNSQELLLPQSQEHNLPEFNVISGKRLENLENSDKGSETGNVASKEIKNITTDSALLPSHCRSDFVTQPSVSLASTARVSSSNISSDSSVKNRTSDLVPPDDAPKIQSPGVINSIGSANNVATIAVSQPETKLETLVHEDPLPTDEINLEKLMKVAVNDTWYPPSLVLDMHSRETLIKPLPSAPDFFSSSTPQPSPLESNFPPGLIPVRPPSITTSVPGVSSNFKPQPSPLESKRPPGLIHVRPTSTMPSAPGVSSSSIPHPTPLEFKFPPGLLPVRPTCIMPSGSGVSSSSILQPTPLESKFPPGLLPVRPLLSKFEAIPRTSPLDLSQMASPSISNEKIIDMHKPSVPSYPTACPKSRKKFYCDLSSPSKKTSSDGKTCPSSSKADSGTASSFCTFSPASDDIGRNNLEPSKASCYTIPSTESYAALSFSSLLKAMHHKISNSASSVDPGTSSDANSSPIKQSKGFESPEELKEYIIDWLEKNYEMCEGKEIEQFKVHRHFFLDLPSAGRRLRYRARPPIMECLMKAFGEIVSTCRHKTESGPQRWFYVNIHVKEGIKLPPIAPPKSRVRKRKRAQKGSASLQGKTRQTSDTKPKVTGISSCSEDVINMSDTLAVLAHLVATTKVIKDRGIIEESEGTVSAMNNGGTEGTLGAASGTDTGKLSHLVSTSSSVNLASALACVNYCNSASSSSSTFLNDGNTATAVSSGSHEDTGSSVNSVPAASLNMSVTTIDESPSVTPLDVGRGDAVVTVTSSNDSSLTSLDVGTSAKVSANCSVISVNSGCLVSTDSSLTAADVNGNQTTSDTFVTGVSAVNEGALVPISTEDKFALSIGTCSSVPTNTSDSKSSSVITSSGISDVTASSSDNSVALQSLSKHEPSSSKSSSLLSSIIISGRRKPLSTLATVDTPIKNVDHLVAWIKSKIAMGKKVQVSKLVVRMKRLRHYDITNHYIKRHLISVSSGMRVRQTLRTWDIRVFLRTASKKFVSGTADRNRRVPKVGPYGSKSAAVQQMLIQARMGASDDLIENAMQPPPAISSQLPKISGAIYPKTTPPIMFERITPILNRRDKYLLTKNERLTTDQRMFASDIGLNLARRASRNRRLDRKLEGRLKLPDCRFFGIRKETSHQQSSSEVPVSKEEAPHVASVSSASSASSFETNRKPVFSTSVHGPHYSKTSSMPISMPIDYSALAGARTGVDQIQRKLYSHYAALGSNLSGYAPGLIGVSLAAPHSIDKQSIDSSVCAASKVVNTMVSSAAHSSSNPTTGQVDQSQSGRPGNRSSPPPRLTFMGGSGINPLRSQRPMPPPLSFMGPPVESQGRLVPPQAGGLYSNLSPWSSNVDFTQPTPPLKSYGNFSRLNTSPQPFSSFLHNMLGQNVANQEVANLPQSIKDDSVQEKQVTNKSFTRNIAEADRHSSNLPHGVQSGAISEQHPSSEPHAKGSYPDITRSITGNVSQNLSTRVDTQYSGKQDASGQNSANRNSRQGYIYSHQPNVDQNHSSQGMQSQAVSTQQSFPQTSHQQQDLHLPHQQLNQRHNVPGHMAPQHQISSHSYSRGYLYPNQHCVNLHPQGIMTQQYPTPSLSSQVYYGTVPPLYSQSLLPPNRTQSIPAQNVKLPLSSSSYSIQNLVSGTQQHHSSNIGQEVVRSQPLSGVAQSQPILSQPLSVGVQSQPSLSQPLSGVVQSQPIFSQPLSGGVQSQPSLSQPLSGVVQTQPIFSQPLSGGVQSQHILSQLLSGVAQSQPVLSKPLSRVVKSQPTPHCTSTDVAPTQGATSHSQDCWSKQKNDMFIERYPSDSKSTLHYRPYYPMNSSSLQLEGDISSGKQYIDDTSTTSSVGQKEGESNETDSSRSLEQNRYSVIVSASQVKQCNQNSRRYGMSSPVLPVSISDQNSSAGFPEHVLRAANALLNRQESTAHALQVLPKRTSNMGDCSSGSQGENNTEETLLKHENNSADDNAFGTTVHQYQASSDSCTKDEMTFASLLEDSTPVSHIRCKISSQQKMIRDEPETLGVPSTRNSGNLDRSSSQTSVSVANTSCSTDTENLEIAGHLSKMETLLARLVELGLPSSSERIISTAKELLEAEGVSVTPFQVNELQNWYYAFNVSCLQNKEEATGKKVLGPSVENDVALWINKTKGELLTFSDAQPNRIFYMQELSFLLDRNTRHIKYHKMFPEIKSCSKEKDTVSVLFTFSADGQIGPGIIIFPRMVIPPRLFSSLRKTDLGKDWVIGSSANGFLYSDCITEFISDVFVPWIETCDLQKPIALYSSECISDIPMGDLRINFLPQGVHLILIPRALSPLVSPAERIIVQWFRKTWGKTIREWSAANGKQSLMEDSFSPFIINIIHENASKGDISKVFHDLGMWPFDGQIIFQRIQQNKL